MREVERIFQLDPEPPVRGNLNDYILETVQSRDLRWFSFFLHHYENRLNGRVRRFLLREGLDRYDPERFLDYKMGCVLAMLDCLQGYDPAQGADFLTYAHHFIGNALLTCRMQEEAGSFENVDEYKAVRGIAWLYNQSGQSEQAAIQKYVQKNGCTEETAAKFLALAKQNRSRVPFYQTIQEADSEETGEEVAVDDSWNYTDILWNGAQAEKIQRAFEKLNFREQTLLEKRLALCMTCGRVSSWKNRPTFEELAVLFEGSTASGAERAYRKATEKLTLLDGGVAQVEIAVLQAQRLVGVAAAVDLERQLVVAAAAEHLDLRGHDLNVAGGLLGVFARALAHGALHGDRGLLVERLDDLHHVLGLDDDLRRAVEIAQNDESKVVAHDAHVFHPAAERDGFAAVGKAQLAAGMSSGLHHSMFLLSV